mmetsp:Transcript_84223/g.188051  ORF Transcript_84223/g.188051 Transcript_84223/m.188051 type:complete len:267 (-) Transcript_84223:66-866(-)
MKARPVWQWSCCCSLLVLAATRALEDLPTPHLDVAFVTHGNATFPIVGFYFPSHDIKVDRACGAPFLGNFWTPALIEGFAPPDYASDPHSFNCSEAAYWASQWWHHAAEFEGKNGQEVFDLAKSLRARGVAPDPTFGGFGSAWAMMRVILRKKFVKGSDLAEALLATKEAYLVEHQEGKDSDNQWSDFCDGSGENWLGLQLMVLRSELRGDRADTWTSFASNAYDLVTGAPRGIAGRAAWMETVHKAAAALNEALPYTCPPRAVHV